MVVQLGTGSTIGPRRSVGDVRLPLSQITHDGTRLEHDLFTPVPIAVTIEKLRGFVADHCARIFEAEHNRIRLQIEHQHSGKRRRRGDRTLNFLMELDLEEGLADENYESDEPTEAPSIRMIPGTHVHVVVTPRTKRDRRANDIMQRSREVLLSLRSYLMATEDSACVIEEESELPEDETPLRDDDLRNLRRVQKTSLFNQVVRLFQLWR
jgi:hypothetical protein